MGIPISALNADRLKEVRRLDNTLVMTCKYDGLGRRRERIVSAAAGVADPGTNRYVYHDWLVLEVRDGGTNVLETYTHGPDLSGALGGAGGIGGLLSHTRPASLDTLYFFYDGNGNVVDVLDDADTFAAHYEYDPFGNRLVADGPHADQPFQWSTKQHHEPSGLVYYGYRYYSPQLGRWLSRDPIGEFGGINLYGFVENNPCMNIDLLGLKGLRPPWWPIIKPILDTTCDGAPIGSTTEFEAEASCVRKCAPAAGSEKECPSCSDQSGKGKGMAVYECKDLGWPWGVRFAFKEWKNGPPACDAPSCNSSGSSASARCEQTEVTWDPPGWF